MLRLNNCTGLALTTYLKAIQDDLKVTDHSIENQSYISAAFKVNSYPFKEGCSVFLKKDSAFLVFTNRNDNSKKKCTLNNQLKAVLQE